MKLPICIAVCLLFLALTLGGGCLEAVLGPGPPAEYPRIVPAEQAGPMQPATFSYRFMDDAVTVTVPLDAGVYEGARNADKHAYLFEDLDEEEWLAGYYRAFVFDEHLDGLFADLHDAFASVRTTGGLDDDEYLEIMTVFVQSLPYESDDATGEPRFPVETIADGRGDCDDKSILLAGLLAREGYDVVLLFFKPEEHMAVGVRADGCSYGTTGYAFIETTNVSFVGVAPAALEDGQVLAPDPVVIRIGEGMKGYGTGDQTAYIDAALHDALDRIASEEPDLRRAHDDLAAAYASLEELRTRMDTLAASGRIGEYNRLVPDYNRQVQEYNEQLEEVSGRQDEYNQTIEVYNYIITHPHDRKGTYAWLREHA
ncbi:MAG: hypothetical protein QCH35_03955 [Methanomicrobiaceae archaeon]|nr:hypothetical protein [Methanomicrobiaceae archaeon]